LKPVFIMFKFMHKKIIICFSILILVSCVSHQYEPDIDKLVEVDDCTIFSGTYSYDEYKDGKRLSEYLFNTEGELARLLPRS
jgi:hypothetical protein